MLFPLMFRPLFEKPDDRNGGGDDPEEDPVEDEVVDDDGDEVEEEDEYATEFEAKLAKDHPELLKEYQETTSGLHSALVKERDEAKKGREARKKLKTYQDQEEEALRTQRTKEENLQNDLDAAKARAEKAEQQLLTAKKERVVLKIAADLKFRTPSDAISFVDMGSLEMGEDEKENEKAVTVLLKDVLKDRKYLTEEDLGEDGNDFSKRRRKMDDDPKTRKKIKDDQPKIPV